MLAQAEYFHALPYSCLDHLIQSVLSMTRAELSRVRVMGERHLSLRSLLDAQNLKWTEL
jgi:hypothetical protein